jgi:hypothetical protein
VPSKSKPNPAKNVKDNQRKRLGFPWILLVGLGLFNGVAATLGEENSVSNPFFAAGLRFLTATEQSTTTSDFRKENSTPVDLGSVFHETRPRGGGLKDGRPASPLAPTRLGDHGSLLIRQHLRSFGRSSAREGRAGICAASQQPPSHRPLISRQRGGVAQTRP